MSCDDCQRLGIPKDLCADGKPIIVEFTNDELLFRRHSLTGDKPEICALPEPVIGAELFKIKDDSYNRSALSKPTDVLLNDRAEDNGKHFLNHGIVSLPADQLTKLEYEYLSNEEKKICTFVIMHTPKPCNYAHSEIFFYLNGEKFTGKKPNKNAITFFRRKLLELMTVVKKTGT